jgi:hypothetical protein
VNGNKIDHLSYNIEVGAAAFGLLFRYKILRDDRNGSRCFVQLRLRHMDTLNLQERAG